jgi:hypothetical protein
LGIGAKVRITLPKPEITLDRAKKWLNNISPTVSVVNEVDPDFIQDLFPNGKAKWRPNHKAKLLRWQGEQQQASKLVNDLQKDFDKLNRVTVAASG